MSETVGRLTLRDVNSRVCGCRRQYQRRDYGGLQCRGQPVFCQRRDGPVDDAYRGAFVRERWGYKEEFRVDGCKVERKWERNDAYKDEIKCDGRRR